MYIYMYIYIYIYIFTHTYIYIYISYHLQFSKPLANVRELKALQRTRPLGLSAMLICRTEVEEN